MVSSTYPEEGAFLVFAHTAKQAKKVGWNAGRGMVVEEYTDLRVRWIRNSPWLRREADAVKLALGTPHVIDNPKSCKSCLQWGHTPIGAQGWCEDCDATLEGRIGPPRTLES